jgi:hypothetical protein
LEEVDLPKLSGAIELIAHLAPNLEKTQVELSRKNYVQQGQR